MPRGIIVFGANGSGKTTLGRELARILGVKHMDIEDYHFRKSTIPYTAVRSNDACRSLMLADIEQYGSFVLSAVTGNFGERIVSMYGLAVYITAPVEIRIVRIEQREYVRHGERIHESGDMFEQHRSFVDFAASRSLEAIDRWAEELSCPILRVDGTKGIAENAEWVAAQWLCLRR